VNKADKADKYELYELAAQSPEATVNFLRAVHAGDPHILGEDFSGTAAVSRAWVKRGEEYTAIAVDHDEEPLRRAAAERVQLKRADVMAADDPADVIAVLNFSIGECHKRKVLLDYLRHVHERLVDRQGILVLDLFGGSSTLVNTAIQIPLAEDVTYTWENEAVNVITNRIGCRMSFQFDDGSEMPAAFFYHWRLWTPCEMIEAMEEAGFPRVEVYDRLGDAVDDQGNFYVSPVKSLYATIDAPYPDDEEYDEPADGSEEETDEVVWRDDFDEDAEIRGSQLPDWQCFVVARTTAV